MLIFFNKREMIKMLVGDCKCLFWVKIVRFVMFMKGFSVIIMSRFDFII